MIEARRAGRKEGFTKRNFSTRIRRHRRISAFLDPREGQRGSNRLFLMDYRPASVSRIWSPGPSWSFRRESLFGRLHFFGGFCWLIPSARPPPSPPSQKHSKCFFELVILSLSGNTKILSNVGTQFFRDGKLLNLRVRWLRVVFAYPNVWCCFFSLILYLENFACLKNGGTHWGSGEIIIWLGCLFLGIPIYGIVDVFYFKMYSYPFIFTLFYF